MKYKEDSDVPYEVRRGTHTLWTDIIKSVKTKHRPSGLKYKKNKKYPVEISYSLENYNRVRKILKDHKLHDKINPKLDQLTLLKFVEKYKPSTDNLIFTEKLWRFMVKKGLVS